jgi:DNA repair protein SbcD/Mre11
VIQILHIADVHLDTTFAGREEHRKTLQSACRRAFERAIDVALENEVAAVLVAGDLFDNDRLTLDTERFLLQQLHRLDERGITCVYVTGNHDPGSNAYRANHIEWTESFHFIRGKRPDTIEITGEDGEVRLRITGAGHITSAVSDNLAAGFPPKTAGAPHVGLLHTMVQAARGSESHDRYAPSTLEDLRAPGYDYWALGHIHIRQEVDAGANAWYSGNIMGRSPRETGLKGANLVTLYDGRKPDVEFIPLADLQWATLDIDSLDECRTSHDLITTVREAFEAHAQNASHVAHWFIRVNLGGPCPQVHRLTDESERESWEQALRDVTGATWVQLRTRRLVAPIDVDAYRDQPHVLSTALSLLDSVRLAEEPPISLLQTWANDPDSEYVRSLLEGAEALIAERFVTSDREV